MPTATEYNSDVHENIPEKYTSHPFTFSGAIIPEMVEFIGLPFPFSSKLKIWSFPARRIKAGTATKCTKKRDVRADLLFCSLNLLLFWRSCREETVVFS